MHKTFGDLIRDLVVDDIIIKIKSHSSLLDNLAIVFDRLRSMCTMLNPNKCVFGVSTGKLLGFLISHRGIEANTKKIKAIE
jgi:dsDNA-binding SOS-regulon protein